MTRLRQLRLTAKILAHCQQRQIPPELVPMLTHSFLSWAQRYPTITGGHLNHCLEAFVQGWIKGSLDFRVSQELTRQETAKN